MITAAGIALAVVAGAGAVRLALRGDPAPVPPAQPPAFATVTVHGRAGTFGSLGPATPSGQPVAHAAVPGWDFAPGVQANRAALGEDGTVLVAGASHNSDFSAPTGDRVTVSAYRPRANTFATVQIGPVGPGAPSVADLTPVERGVAYVTRPARGSALGAWPAFGVLATVDGQWRDAPLTGEVTGDDFHDMTALPRSRDILVAQYGRKGEANGGLLALRLTGPDADGRFAVEERGRYQYPRVAGHQVSVREVQVDPTGRDGDERFAVGLDVTPGRNLFPHQLVQEFRYDAATGDIRPVSAPLVPGDRTKEGHFYTYGAFRYDRAGNLWVSRGDGFLGGSLAVFAAGDGRRRLAGGECRLRTGRSLDSYRAVAGGVSVWGQPCRPDYDILQAHHLPVIIGLAQDPVSGDMVGLGFGGVLLAVRATPSGAGLAFQIGNAVDLGRKLLGTVPGGLAEHRIGPVDGAHRLWVTGMHAAPGRVGERLDQWLYSVDLTDLFAPAAVALPGTPGRSVTIQAERSTVIGTSTRRGAWARTDVDSVAYAQGCADHLTGTTCGYDGVAGNGFVIGDDSGFGLLAGGLEYRVDVPTAGRYRLSVRIATFAPTKTARIAVSAGGRERIEAVDTGGGYRTVRLQPIALPAGPQVVRLAVPEDGGGWFLNWFTLQRV